MRQCRTGDISLPDYLPPTAPTRPRAVPRTSVILRTLKENFIVQEAHLRLGCGKEGHIDIDPAV